MTYEYRVYVYLAGDTKMHLCTIINASMVGELIAILLRPERPEYHRIEVEIAPRSVAS